MQSKCPPVRHKISVGIQRELSHNGRLPQVWELLWKSLRITWDLVSGFNKRLSNRKEFFYKRVSNRTEDKTLSWSWGLVEMSSLIGLPLIALVSSALLLSHHFPQLSLSECHCCCHSSAARFVRYQILLLVSLACNAAPCKCSSGERRGELLKGTTRLSNFGFIAPTTPSPHPPQWEKHFNNMWH